MTMPHSIKSADKAFRDNDGATSIIPEGMYCYGKDGRCPYWAISENHEEQENGYCAFLKEGDWQDEGCSLLWDQVKECGINNDSDEDIEEDQILGLESGNI